MRSFLAPVIFAFAALGCDSKPSPTAEGDDKSRMQGRWTVVAAERNGKAAPADEIKGVEVKIEDDKMTFVVKGDKKGKKLSFSVDPSKSPKGIDFTETYYTPGGVKGRVDYVTEQTETTKGIYELNEDMLTICKRQAGVLIASAPTKDDKSEDNLKPLNEGNPRPTSLAPKDRQNIEIFVFKRVR